MGQPITVYTPEGEKLIMHSPNVIKEMVKEGKLFMSPPDLTISDETVNEIGEALGLDEEE